MRNILRNTLVTTSTMIMILNASTAFADVTWKYEPDLLEGDFEVTCNNNDSLVAFDVAIAVGQLSWAGAVTSPTPCDADSPEVYQALATFGEDAYTGCMDLIGWIDDGEEACRELVGSLVVGIYNAHKGLVEMVPDRMTNMTIANVGDPWADFWNLYPYAGTSVTTHSAGGVFGATCEGEETMPWEGQLCDETLTSNEGNAELAVNRNGEFIDLALAIAPIAQGVACLATVIGGFAGSFDETGDFDVTYAANGSLWCGASNPYTGLLVGTIGVSIAGVANGEPMNSNQ